MSFLRSVVQQNIPIWDACLQTPFLQQVHRGTLPEDLFREYMIESSLYLYGYAKVFAQGLVKAPDLATMRHFNAMIHSIFDDTYTREHLDRLGVTPEIMNSRKPCAQTQAYLDHMLRAAESPGLADLVMAVLPCMLSYCYMGAYLSSDPAMLKDNPYASWIAGFASEKYVSDSTEWALYAHTLCETLSDDRKDKLCEIFTRSSQHELAFWDLPAVLVAQK